jgi:predicted lipoprotein with Yx(FWY)xxD motif
VQIMTKNPDIRPARRTVARRVSLASAGGIAALALLAACGSGSNDNADAQSNTGNGNTAKALVSTQDTGKAGTVLVDSSGKTLYFSEQEKSGKIDCTGACLDFWFPLTTTGKAVPTPDGVSGKLGTLMRSDDGKRQVTYNGAPLYTFKLDTSAGDMKGNDFSDSFGTKHFTWHAAGAMTASNSPSSKSTSGGNGGGYPNY